MTVGLGDSVVGSRVLSALYNLGVRNPHKLLGVEGASLIGHRAKGHILSGRYDYLMGRLYDDGNVTTEATLLYMTALVGLLSEP